MNRSITRTFPLLALIACFFLSSCSDSMYSKRHYGNSMYVKVDKQKQETTTQGSAEAATRASGDLTMLPQRSAGRLGDNETAASPLCKLEQRIASVMPKVQRTQRSSTSAAAVNNTRSGDVQMVQTVNRTPAEVTQDIDGDDVTNVLVILGVILIIIGVVALILEVATFGWVGLLIAGLLIILLAYLLF